MKASDNPLVGRWRIVEADLWDRDYLDLCGPASLVVRANGHGEIAFGAMQASLDVDYGPDGSASPGPASTRWTRSTAPAPPNCSTMAPPRSSSSTTSAMKPSSKLSARLLQQPARGFEDEAAQHACDDRWSR